MREAEDLFTAERDHLPFGGVELRLRDLLHRSFLALDVQPGMFDEEAVHRFACMFVKAVIKVADADFSGIRRTQQGMDLFHFGVRLACAAQVEIAVFLGQYHGGTRRIGQQQVCFVQAKSQRPRRVLFGVSRQFIFEVAQPTGDEAVRRRHRDARVEGRQLCGLGSAAGAAGDADSARVRLRPLQQIVEAADGIPGEPAANKVAGQQHAVADHIVGNRRAGA